MRGAAGPPLRTEAEVVASRREGVASRRLVLRLAGGWPGFTPGQFVMLSPGACGGAERFDPLLPRPMAIYRVTPRGGAHDLEILYQVTGRGTRLLAVVRPGDRVRVVGPLGRGFPAPPAGSRAVLVGGGTGVASLLELASRAAQRAKAVVLLGARTEADLMGQGDFAALAAELHVATEDGSLGSRGLVTELLEKCLGSGDGSRVYACGPAPMMRVAADIAARTQAPCWVSLENTMACGFGVCLGCAVPRAGNGFALVCRDGPVFEAGAIDWESLA